MLLALGQARLRLARRFGAAVVAVLQNAAGAAEMGKSGRLWVEQAWTWEQAIARFLTARPQRFEPEKEGLVFSSVYFQVNPATGRALLVRREMIIEESSD